MNDALLQDLVSFARKDSVDLVIPEGKRKEGLSNRLKSLLARQIWRSEGYYEVVNANDPMMRKALEATKGK